MSQLSRFLRAEWDRVAGYGCIVAGVVALGFGFLGVRDAADVIDEISYLVTGGIGAMFLLGVGATLLLSADLHDDFRKLHRVEEKLDRIYQALAAERPDLLETEAVAAVSGDNPGPPGTPVDLRDDGAVAPPGEKAVLACGPGMPAVARARRLAAPVVLLAAGLFGTGVVMTVTESGTQRLARGVGFALAGALVVAAAAGGMVGQLKGLLEQRKLVALGPWLADGALSAGPAPAAQVWAVEGLGLYHRAGCQALAGRSAAPQSGEDLRGLRPCGLCEPGPER